MRVTAKFRRGPPPSRRSPPRCLRRCRRSPRDCAGHPRECPLPPCRPGPRRHRAPLVKMPPPSARQDRDERPPKPRPTSGFDDVAGRRTGRRRTRHDRVVTRDAEQAQADDQEARDRAPTEGKRQRFIQADPGSLRGTHVGANRDIHSDIAGRPRQDDKTHAPSAKPQAVAQPRPGTNPMTRNRITPTMPMVVYWAFR